MPIDFKEFNLVVAEEDPFKLPVTNYDMPKRSNNKKDVIKADNPAKVDTGLNQSMEWRIQNSKSQVGQEKILSEVEKLEEKRNR